MPVRTRCGVMTHQARAVTSRRRDDDATTSAREPMITTHANGAPIACTSSQTAPGTAALSSNSYLQRQPTVSRLRLATRPSANSRSARACLVLRGRGAGLVIVGVPARYVRLNPARPIATCQPQDAARASSARNARSPANATRPRSVASRRDWRGVRSRRGPAKCRCRACRTPPPSSWFPLVRLLFIMLQAHCPEAAQEKRQETTQVSRFIRHFPGCRSSYTLRTWPPAADLLSGRCICHQMNGKGLSAKLRNGDTKRA